MSPFLLDLTKDECRRILRRLELDAYSSVVSAFRAQGHLTKDKKKTLHDLCIYLGISTERYRAEIRRAANDEKLATISEQIAGGTLLSDWMMEGQRLIPLMPRLVPQTAFTSIATKTANTVASQNSNLKTYIKFPVQQRTLRKTDDGGNLGDKLAIVAEKRLATSTENSPSESNTYLPTEGPMEVTSICGEEVQNEGQQSSISTSQNMSMNIHYCEPSVKVVDNFLLPPKESSDFLTGNVNSEDMGKHYSCKYVSCDGTLTPDRSDVISSSTSGGNSPVTKVIIFPASSPTIQSTVVQRAHSVSTVKVLDGTITSESGFQAKSAALKIKPATSKWRVSVDTSTEEDAVAAPDSNKSVSSFGGPAQLESTQQSSHSGSSVKIITQGLPRTTTTKVTQKPAVSNSAPIVVVTKTTPQGSGGQSGARVVNVITTKTPTGKVVSPASLAFGKACNTSAVVVGPNGQQTAIVKVAPRVSLATASGKPNVIVVQKGHVLANPALSSLGGVMPSTLSGMPQNILKSGKEAFVVHTEKNLADLENKSTVLADILQAAGILPEMGSDAHSPKLSRPASGIIRLEKVVPSNNVVMKDDGEALHPPKMASLRPIGSSDIASSPADDQKILVSESTARHESNLIAENICVMDSGGSKSSCTKDAIEESGKNRSGDHYEDDGSLSSCHDNGELDPQTGIFYPFDALDRNKAMNLTMMTKQETSEECFELDGENAYQQQSDRAEDIIVDHVDMNRTVFVRESICLKEEEKVTSYEIASSQTDIEDDQPVLDMTQTKQSDINSAVEMQNLLYTGVTYSKDKCLPRKELLKFTVSDYDDAIMQDPQMNTQLYGEQENDGIALNVVSGNVLEVIQCEGIPFTSGIEETVVTTNGKDDMLVEAIDNNYGPDTSTTDEGQDNNFPLMKITLKNIMMNSESQLSGSSLFMVTDSSIGDKSLEFPVVEVTNDVDKTHMTSSNTSVMEANELHLPIEEIVSSSELSKETENLNENVVRMSSDSCNVIDQRTPTKRKNAVNFSSTNNSNWVPAAKRNC